MFSSRKSNGVHGASPATLSKSLRFRSSATAYLNRTFGTPTNNLKYTLSLWVKRGTLGVQNILFDGGDATGNNNAYLQINPYDQLNFSQNLAGNANINLITTQIFRDPSAWYHIVLAVDTTQATSTDRVKIYINGVQITSFGTAVYPTLNLANQVNVASRVHNIGKLDYASLYLDAYLTDVYFIDGQQLTPSSFGATNATTGQWSPAIYSGSYGNNGFHLTFTNTTSTTTLGYDTSGNSNNWTTNNISLTAGSTYDSMNDVPTLTSATAANTCTLNPLYVPNGSVNYTLSNGNISYAANPPSGQAGYSVCASTMSLKGGEFYWEVIFGTNIICGILDLNGGSSTGTYTGYTLLGVYSGGGATIANSSATYSGSQTFTSGDVIGFAYSTSGATLKVYKNNTLVGTFSSVETTKNWSPQLCVNASGSTANATINFGQQPFTYTPPSGYVALNTYNLPTPTIAQGNKYMDATLYTGTGASQSIVNAGAFQPDLIWFKSIGFGYPNQLTDSVRGVTKQLESDSAAAETTYAGYVTSFNSNGYSIGAGDNGSNGNGYVYVAWQWQAGKGSNVSNTNGSITSTVSASTTAGFSVVTYTGTGTAGTIGHGLGVAPSMIIVKSRSATGDWPVYHSSLGNGSYVLLDTTAASAASSTIWNATSPTSSVFSVGINTVSNTITVTYVAYCFTPIAGFSAFGSYTGGSSTLLPFVYCGFRPRFIMIKDSSASTAYTSWYMIDTARLTGNISSGTEPSLWANLSAAEGNRGNGSATDTYDYVNILSNGFQVAVPSMTDELNTSGNTYIYAAFAENPFKYANAR